MKCQLQNIVKSALILTMGIAVAASAQSESFCSVTSHSSTAQKKTVSRNEVGKIGNIGYELWDENGSGGNATFYDDGSMDCNITSAKDYLCRAGLSFNSDKTYDQLGGDMIAEFKLIKNSGQNVQYSYIGVYGWMEGVSGTQSNLVEYYVIDNTLSQSMPGNWIGDTPMGDIQVDGGTYTVYRNTRTGPAIKNSGNVQFYQYFSVRKSPRDCGTINISEHMRQWEKKGLKMGKLYEAKVLGEAGNTGSNVTGGKMDFPHAKVYVGGSEGSSSAESTTTTGGDQGGNQGGNTDAGNTGAGQGGNGGFDWGNFDWGNFDWGNMGGGDAGQGGNGGFNWGGDQPSGKTEALSAPVVNMNAAKTFSVFGANGRYLGDVDLQPGTSIHDALFAKFGKTGVYMVKNGSKTISVKVSH